jgi:energy-converting hydrogenase Eha subunit C
MFQEQVSNESTKANLELFCDIEVFLGFVCIILMLKCVQSLFKFAQIRYAFICDFVAIVKSC